MAASEEWRHMVDARSRLEDSWEGGASPSFYCSSSFRNSYHTL